MQWNGEVGTTPFQVDRFAPVVSISARGPEEPGTTSLVGRADSGPIREKMGHARLRSFATLDRPWSEISAEKIHQQPEDQYKLGI